MEMLRSFFSNFSQVQQVQIFEVVFFSFLMLFAYYKFKRKEKLSKLLQKCGKDYFEIDEMVKKVRSDLSCKTNDVYEEFRTYNSKFFKTSKMYINCLSDEKISQRVRLKKLVIIAKRFDEILKGFKIIKDLVIGHNKLKS